MKSSDKWLIGLPADATVADAARVALASRTEEAASRLKLAASDAWLDPRHVHQLRVAARRTAAVLRVFKKVFPDKQADKLSWVMLRMRRAAGPARDLDVFRLRLEQQGVLPGLQGRLYAQREALQGDLERACAKLKGGKKIRRRAEKLVRRTPAGNKAARRLAKKLFSDWAPEPMNREVNRFLAAAPAIDAELSELHRFRIAAKRLRYALEVLSPGLPAGVREACYPLLKDLQDRLGAINDHATAAAWLGQAMPAASSSEQASLRSMMRREDLAQQEKVAQFHEWWDESRVERLATALRTDQQ